MKGCWDPEFEPSVEEIMDYQWDMAILLIRFLWRARMACGGHIRINRLKPQAPMYAYTENLQFVDVS